jgi:hypothetical protein
MGDATIYSRARGQSEDWPWTEHTSERTPANLKDYGKRLVQAGFDVHIVRDGETLFYDVLETEEA